MAKIVGSISFVVRSGAGQISDKVIFWALVATVFVTGISMIRSVPGL